jgi:hypothetical protein
VAALRHAPQLACARIGFSPSSSWAPLAADCKVTVMLG